MLRIGWVLLALAIAGGGCDCGRVLFGDKDGGAGDRQISFTDGGSADAGNASCVDSDGDGYGPGCSLGPDCDPDDRAVHPGAVEICGDGVDNDCDPATTDSVGCETPYGATRECYSGPPGSAQHPPCHQGIQRMGSDGQWGPCQGEEVPAAGELPREVSCDGVDNDCDGVVDGSDIDGDGHADVTLLNACGACGALPAEICYNGLDDDCDNQLDEADASCECDPNCAFDGNEVRCHPPINQPCYTGLPSTAGQGICQQGLHDCSWDAASGRWIWSECRDQRLPAAAESCGNNQDDDCDGLVDEGCNPACTPTSEVCDGIDNDCDQVVDEGVLNACGYCGAAPEEYCGDGLDNDCDGRVDEVEAGCVCVGGDSQACYTGPPLSRGLGECQDGLQDCSPGEQGYWGPCVGDRLPSPEICGDGLDNDCDDLVDEGCLCQDGQLRTCGTDVGECSQGNELCRGGQWGPCSGQGPVTERCDGLDNDCDGLVDEGVLNACGLCPDRGLPCWGQSYSFPQDFGGGTANGVSTASQNPGFPEACRTGGAVCLDSTVSSSHFMWLAGTTQWWEHPTTCGTIDTALANGCYDTVIKLDTRTGAVVGTYSSWGWSPSRTAVNPNDNSVWVGNRGCRDNLSDCRGDDPRAGNVTHLDVDGNLICRAYIGDPAQAATSGRVGVRAVTLDAEGDAWAGMWSQAKLYKIDSHIVDPPGADGVPRCRVVADRTVNLADAHGTSRAYGAAVDSQGFLWIATLGDGASNEIPVPVRKIDTGTGAIVATVSWGTGPGQIQCSGAATPFSAITYGIAVDGSGNAWYGLWQDGLHGVIRVYAAGTACHYFGNSRTGHRSRGVAIDANGEVWVANWTDNTISKYASTGTHLVTVPVDDGVQGASGPLGMGVDADNNIWAIDYGSGHASKFDSAGTLIAVYPVPALTGGLVTPYTYSDFTGLQNRLITNRNGSWTIDFDSGYANAHWRRIDWQGLCTPPVTTIAVRAKSAATQSGLDSSANLWTDEIAHASPPPPPPADITGLVPDNRWLRVQVLLRTQDPNQTPVVQGITVGWEY
ncbi:MAG: hypothetical protein JXR83_11565 [Deltaproteobacteria bacterium]|nr:hypothetical protein [Deltaproteobacteria bacterium]